MGIFAWIRFIVTVLIAAGVLVASVIAIIDAARIPAGEFIGADKRTKRFWLLILGAGVLFAVLGALQMVGIFMNIIAIVPAAAYWYGVRSDVKPARVKAARPKATGARLGTAFNRNKNAVKLSPMDSRPAGKASDPRFDV